MNLLALLCNLYAEGPATLRILRRAGIRTLPNVLATSDWALAELLGGSPATARRFAREAARLSRNVDSSFSDQEEAGLVFEDGNLGARGIATSG